MYHNLPVRLNKTIGGLTLGRSRDNFGIVVDEIFWYCHAGKLSITVTVETASKQTSRSAKEANCQENAFWLKSLEAKSSIVSSGSINKDEGITKPTNWETITKSNIHMHHIEIAVSGMVKDQSTFGFGNSGKRAKGRRKLPTINPFTIMTNLQDVLVVPKLSTTHNAINFFSRPMSLGVQSIPRITRPNRWKRRTWVMEELGDLVKEQSWEQDGRRRRSGSLNIVGQHRPQRLLEGISQEQSWAVMDSISKDGEGQREEACHSGTHRGKEAERT
jgi:hypothetical protein